MLHLLTQMLPTLKNHWNGYEKRIFILYQLVIQNELLMSQESRPKNQDLRPET